MTLDTRMTSNMKTKPNRIYLTKIAKPDLSNQNYKTKSTNPTEPNIPNETFQSNKIKAPTLNSWTRSVIKVNKDTIKARQV